MTYIYFLIIKNKPKRWKSNKWYVFCGRNYSGTITLSKFKESDSDKTHKFEEQIYDSSGIDTTKLLMGRVYSFKRLSWFKKDSDNEGYNVRITTLHKGNDKRETKIVEFKPKINQV